jgi:aspartate racemase
MKTIGLVGGMTPESTMIYYRMLIELGGAQWDDQLSNPVVIVDSLDLSQIAAHRNVREEDQLYARNPRTNRILTSHLTTERSCPCTS